MEGQMTIFDIIKPNSLDDLPEEEMVKQVSDATGLNFKYRDDFWKWECKVKDVRFSLHYSNYSIDDKRRFISCGYDRKAKEGCGSPIDSLEEAIAFFRKAKERYEIA